MLWPRHLVRWRAFVRYPRRFLHADGAVEKHRSTVRTSLEKLLINPESRHPIHTSALLSLAALHRQGAWDETATELLPLLMETLRQSCSTLLHDNTLERCSEVAYSAASLLKYGADPVAVQALVLSGAGRVFASRFGLLATPSARLLIAIAFTQQKDVPLKLVERLALASGRCDARDAAAALWACAVMKCTKQTLRSERSLVALAESALQQHRVAPHDPSTLCCMVWALAVVRAGTSHTEYGELAQKLVEDKVLDTESTCKVLWAVSIIDRRRVPDLLSSFGPPDDLPLAYRSSVLMALANSGSPPPLGLISRLAAPGGPESAPHCVAILWTLLFTCTREGHETLWNEAVGVLSDTNALRRLSPPHLIDLVMVLSQAPEHTVLEAVATVVTDVAPHFGKMKEWCLDMLIALSSAKVPTSHPCFPALARALAHPPDLAVSALPSERLAEALPILAKSNTWGERVEKRFVSLIILCIRKAVTSSHLPTASLVLSTVMQLQLTNFYPFAPRLLGHLHKPLSEIEGELNIPTCQRFLKGMALTTKRDDKALKTIVEYLRKNADAIGPIPAAKILSSFARLVYKPSGLSDKLAAVALNGRDSANGASREAYSTLVISLATLHICSFSTIEQAALKAASKTEGVDRHMLERVVTSMLRGSVRDEPLFEKVVERCYEVGHSPERFSLKWAVEALLSSVTNRKGVLHSTLGKRFFIGVCTRIADGEFASSNNTRRWCRVLLAVATLVRHSSGKVRMALTASGRDLLSQFRTRMEGGDLIGFTFQDITHVLLTQAHIGCVEGALVDQLFGMIPSVDFFPKDGNHACLVLRQAKELGLSEGAVALLQQLAVENGHYLTESSWVMALIGSRDRGHLPDHFLDNGLAALMRAPGKPVAELRDGEPWMAFELLAVLLHVKRDKDRDTIIALRNLVTAQIGKAETRGSLQSIAGSQGSLVRVLTGLNTLGLNDEMFVKSLRKAYFLVGSK